MISTLRVLMYALPVVSMAFAPLSAKENKKQAKEAKAAKVAKKHSRSHCSSSGCSHTCTWGLDPTFNGCSTTPGILISPVSPFLDIAESIAIDNCNSNCCKWRYLISGDSVQVPNYCSGAVDGHADERGAAVQAFNHAGTRDIFFATNGVLRFNTTIYGNASNTVLVQCSGCDCNDIFVIGNAQTSPTGEYSSGTVGNCNPLADCGFQFSLGPDNTPQYLGEQIYLARFNCNGSATGTDGNYVDGVATLTQNPTTTPGLGFGEQMLTATWQDAAQQQIISVGLNQDSLSGCGPADAEILSVNVSDASVNWDNTISASDWVDLVNPANPLLFAIFQGVTTNTVGSTTSIYAAGVADAATASDFFSFTGRGIAAKFDTNGNIDPTFGYVTISANDDGNGNPAQQIVIRTITTDGNFLYLGGDIANAFSGNAGQVTASSPGAPGELIARISANFLIVVLNMDGTPVSIDPTLNQNTVQLNWNNGTGPNVQFNAIQTDFFGSEDAIFALKVDGNRLVAAGFSAFGPDLESQRPIVARYKINDSLNLDKSFNDSGFVYLQDIAQFRSLARDLAIEDQPGCSDKRYLITGQAAVAALVTSPVTFLDATQTNMFIAALSHQGEG
ncbi:MAG: hypothetical protein JSR46_11610 [Verrucomicrobia bacterium]|nr:hypothetical protein [Verrucomicrobiota bacterium]